MQHFMVMYLAGVSSSVNVFLTLAYRPFGTVHAEASVPLRRAPPKVDTVELWQHLHSLPRRHEGCVLLMS